MNQDFFKGIMQWELSSGANAGKVPVFYYDNTAITAVFTASTSRVRQYLPLDRMHPAELYPGRCLVAFTAFEYRRTDINPYNELSISVLISFGSRAIPGVTVAAQFLRRCLTAWVWHLPVTTEIARAGGVDLYGYPKFLADITFERRTDSIACQLSAGSSKVLTLRGKVLPAKRGKVVRYVTYSVKDGIPLAANVYTNQVEYAERRGADAVELEIGSGHPICDELRSIELSATPLLYQFAPVTQAILFAPRNLIDN
jgi:hypothetical protein